MQAEFDLEEVLFALQDNKVRATYGAVADLVGSTPMFVMSQEPRTPLHSWVVNKKTGKPTKYKEEQMHQDLFENDRVIHSSFELKDLVENHKG